MQIFKLFVRMIDTDRVKNVYDCVTTFRNLFSRLILQQNEQLYTWNI